MFEEEEELGGNDVGTRKRFGQDPFDDVNAKLGSVAKQVYLLEGGTTSEQTSPQKTQDKKRLRKSVEVDGESDKPKGSAVPSLTEGDQAQ